MTLILGLTIKSHSYILGDSAAAKDDHVEPVVTPKVWKVKSHNMLMGYTSSFRMGDLLKYYWNPPEHPKGMSDEEYLATLFVESMIDVFQRGLWLSSEGGKIIGGEMLCIYNGTIHVVQPNFSVITSVHTYKAIGSGQHHAEGAMHSTDGLGLKPKERMLRAASAAESYTGSVCGPFQILRVKNV